MLYRHQEQLNPVINTQALESKKSECASGITEIVLPNQQGLDMVLPSLAFLSRTDSNSDRWLTWFPPTGVSKKLLQDYDFDLSKVRFVYPKNDEQCYWLLWEALAEGNSHTVVASPGILTEQQVKRLEHASTVGQCSGLLLRSRVH